VDAARSVDPVNRENTFISYYTYGSVLGLALDLTLRKMENDKNLDDFMKLVWQRFGKTEIPYTVRDIKAVLADYAGDDLADTFFSTYIYDSQMPDYQKLFETVGVSFEQAHPDRATLGTPVEIQNGRGVLQSNALVGSPLYEAGIELGDKILSIGGRSLEGADNIDLLMDNFSPGNSVEIKFERWGEQKTTQVELHTDPAIRTEVNPEAGSAAEERRNVWIYENEVKE